MTRSDPLKSHPREEAKWIPPTGWFELNFDGSSKGNPIPARVGEIFIDHIGKIVVIIGEPLGHQTSHLAEARETFIYLTFLEMLRCTKWMLVGYSLNIINMLSGTSPPRWNTSSMIQEAKNT